MALATLTFPTTIYYKNFLLCFIVKYKIINSGFHRFYGYFLNGEVLSIHRSLKLNFINVFGNLYSSHYILWLYPKIITQVTGL